MCDSLNIPIDTLKRIRVMNIKLGTLKQNEYREIKGEELEEFLHLLSL